LNSAPCLCLSQARIRISIGICGGVFCVQWFDVRGNCFCYSFCCYWRKWCPEEVMPVTVLTFFSQSIFAIQFFLLKIILKVQQLYFFLFSYIYVLKKCRIILEYMVLVVRQSAVIQICVVR
jgi:hypothetical protein